MVHLLALSGTFGGPHYEYTEQSTPIGKGTALPVLWTLLVVLPCGVALLFVFPYSDTMW